jgi:hypothetical protein
VEVIGILSNIDIPDFDYAKLVTKYNLLGLFTRILNAAIASSSVLRSNSEASGIMGTEEDDLYLEAIVWIGAIAVDENMGGLIAGSNLIPLLLEVMAGM